MLKFRAIVAATLFFASMLPAYVTAEAGASDEPGTVSEHQAEELLKKWATAWETHNASAVTAYMTQDVAFRLDPSQPLQHGRERLTKIIDTFISAIESLNFTRLSAVSGETDTVVLTERMDRFVGSDTLVQVAGVFRVKDGKIEEWFDIPLSSKRPPPPAGALISAP